MSTAARVAVWDYEAVQVGRVFAYPDVAASYLDQLSPADFITREAETVWRLMQELRPSGGQEGYIAVQAKLTTRGLSTPQMSAFMSDAWKLGHSKGLDPAYDAGRRSGDVEQEQPKRFKLLSLAELENLRDPEWQAAGMIPQGGLVVVYGPPGAGKSFFVLGLVLSVAYGVPFHGQAIKAGPVLYVAAEGSAGLKARVRAWKTANAITTDAPAHFYPDAVSLLDVGAITTLIGELKALPALPLLIVFDTFARCMPGGDENSARDVGLAIAHADRVRKETGAAVLLVHHTSKAGEVERGSTALRGAADTMIQVKADDGLLSVVCDKQKEAEPFAKLALRLQPVAESCVLQPANGHDQNTLNLPTHTEREALACLAGSFLADGATFTDWLKASNIPERSFYRVRTALVEKGYAVTDGEKRGARYTLTDRGRAVLAANLPQPANNLPGTLTPLAANLPHSFRSGRHGRNGSAGEADELEGVFDAA